MEQFSFFTYNSDYCCYDWRLFGAYDSKGKKPSEKWLDMCGMLPNMVPGIVMVCRAYFILNSPYMPLSIYNTPVMVIVTYVVLFYLIPCSMQKHRSGKLMISCAGRKYFFWELYVYFQKIILLLLSRAFLLDGR